ncbi:hypothetical protein FRC01_000332 [Tulasnella sp. 417]|nr:hypothetical protein FRC01_000332 [Tulasnella sp. 417]
MISKLLFFTVAVIIFVLLCIILVILRRTAPAVLDDSLPLALQQPVHSVQAQYGHLARFTLAWLDGRGLPTHRYTRATLHYLVSADVRGPASRVPQDPPLHQNTDLNALSNLQQPPHQTPWVVPRVATDEGQLGSSL